MKVLKKKKRNSQVDIKINHLHPIIPCIRSCLHEIHLLHYIDIEYKYYMTWPTASCTFLFGLHHSKTNANYEQINFPEHNCIFKKNYAVNK